jgi:peptidoglycan/LPS O-acetylase OafA/YrhL
MVKNMNSRVATNYLKAFAILTVCANHFINVNISDSFKGYANGFMSIFFLLSGYGIYLSLEKQMDKPFPDFFAFFIKKRVMRIYPLFWIWCFLHGFPDGILGFLGLNFIQPKTPWFIPAIVQCYIFAPFLFIFTNRIKIKYSLPAICGVFAIINILLFMGDLSPIRSIGFRNLFFLHIFQFYLGYILAKIEKDISCPKYVVYISLLLLIFFVHETTSHAFLWFFGKKYLFPLLLSFSAFILCLSALSSKIILPFQKTMNFIGIHTFSIFLFHDYSFKVLARFGMIHPNNTQLSGVLIWLMTLPLFFLVFAAVETTVNEFVFGQKSFKKAFDVYLKKLSFNA